MEEYYKQMARGKINNSDIPIIPNQRGRGIKRGKKVKAIFPISQIGSGSNTKITTISPVEQTVNQAMSNIQEEEKKHRRFTSGRKGIKRKRSKSRAKSSKRRRTRKKSKGRKKLFKSKKKSSRKRKRKTKSKRKQTRKSRKPRRKRTKTKKRDIFTRK